MAFVKAGEKQGLNNEQILQICKSKGHFKVHKYSYSKAKLRWKLKRLCNSGKLKFWRQANDNLFYIIPLSIVVVPKVQGIIVSEA